MVQGGVETEVKIRVRDVAAAKAVLEAAAFVPAVDRVFEVNTLYDRPDAALRNAGMVLRLRQAGEQCVITWKGPSEGGRHKNRPELETSIGSFETMEQILRQLSYVRAFRYEKYRTEFKQADGTATLDETPIGVFLELEGPAAWIDDAAGRLGFSEQDYVLDSYVKLYVSDCERRGVEPGDMVFVS